VHKYEFCIVINLTPNKWQPGEALDAVSPVCVEGSRQQTEETFIWDCLTLVDGTDTLGRNVGNQLPTYTALTSQKSEGLNYTAAVESKQSRVRLPRTYIHSRNGGYLCNLAPTGRHARLAPHHNIHQGAAGASGRGSRPACHTPV
jgi:hypothetical protein